VLAAQLRLVLSKVLRFVLCRVSGLREGCGSGHFFLAFGVRVWRLGLRVWA